MIMIYMNSPRVANATETLVSTITSTKEITGINP